MEKIYTYLALGDSYTVGEAVLLYQSFPYQTVRLLREKGFNFSAPEIIAKTGWTTDELKAGINSNRFLPWYDFVTLLIGVNNQYRGRDLEGYKTEFRELLGKAIQFAEGNKDHVAIISIPDYSVTLYAANLDKQKIFTEINDYNQANREIATEFGVKYIDIITDSRLAASDPSLLAIDGLHPSEKMYLSWAEKLAKLIAETV
jgi:lysophospholipase L1-like esterase